MSNYKAAKSYLMQQCLCVCESENQQIVIKMIYSLCSSHIDD